MLKLAGINLGQETKVSGRGWIYGRGAVTIGQGTWLSPGVIIYSHQEAPITIKHSCDIGPNVIFIPGSHEFGPPSRRAGKGIAKPITIGEGTWIGANSTILGDVSIGSGCIIAAGAVVTHSIPSNSLAAGVPAIVKRNLK